MYLRFAVAAFIAASLLSLQGCDEHSYVSVWIVSGPDHVAPGEAATFVVTSKSTNWSPSFRYKMHWGDTAVVDTQTYSPGDTAHMVHTWSSPGRYAVWATAHLTESDSQISSSAARTVIVSSDADPVIDSARFRYLWRPTELVVFAHDPAGESLKLAVAWGDAKADTTGYRASPGSSRAIHSYADYGHKDVVFRVLSRSGAASAPETLSAYVTTIGGVVKYWLGSFDGSPAADSDVVYIIAPDYLFGLREVGSEYVWAGSFAGHLCYSGQTGHLYAGMQDGHLRALTRELVPAWRYPSDESITSRRWGPVAVRGSMLYVPCSNDSIYCLADDDTSATRRAAFSAAEVDAVVLDSDGNVYFGDGQGCLFKLTSGLELVRKVQLQSDGVIYAPVIGADGIVYCASSTNHVYSVAADGSVRWDVTLAGTCLRPVIGLDGLFAGTSTGILYKLDLSSGATLWQSQLGDGPLSPAPVLVTEGSAYVQTDDDRLYCINESSGDSVWVCNASDFLPSLPHTLRPSSTDVLSPTVDANGRIYLVGSGALYQLSSYARLDAGAPWPKWQHDLHNTGYVGGGR